MGRQRFVSAITTTVAIITGLALFMIAGTGVRALGVHILRGDTVSALSVAGLLLAAFVVCLMFLMPGALRQMIELGGRPGYRGPMAFGASLVLLAVLVASAGAEGRSGNLVLGLLPRAAF
jgi:hypothetical protein